MRQYLFVLLVVISNVIYAAEKPLITIYTYHLKPPLIVNLADETGLYFDFTRYLNKHSQQYQFETVFVPRKRIERMLKNNALEGVLLGVNPIWFKDKAETKYHWTPRIFTDRDEVISLKSTPIEYSNASSLTDKVFGGVRGFYYFGINELIKSNKAVRIDTASEIDLFSMLLNKRIDAAVVSRSTFDYVVNQKSWQNKFHLSKKPHDIFDRRLLIPRTYSKLYQHLTVIIEQLQFDKSWRDTINSYH